VVLIAFLIAILLYREAQREIRLRHDRESGNGKPQRLLE
jgi:hypothetical protein